MKTLSTIEEVRDLVNANNYYFKENEFDGYFELKEAAEEHFRSNGLPGEVVIEKIKTEKYFIDEVNTTVTVEFYEAYVDSGVNNEDYFHGFLIEF